MYPVKVTNETYRYPSLEVTVVAIRAATPLHAFRATIGTAQEIGQMIPCFSSLSQ